MSLTNKLVMEAEQKILDYASGATTAYADCIDIVEKAAVCCDKDAAATSRFENAIFQGHATVLRSLAQALRERAQKYVQVMNDNT